MSNEKTCEASYNFMVVYDNFTFFASIANKSRKITLRDRLVLHFLQVASHKIVFKNASKINKKNNMLL